MPNVTTDAYGHTSVTSAGTLGAVLTAGAVSTTAIGTIVPTTAAGASPTVSGVVANDVAGHFVLNPVTGGGAQAAGAVAQIFFAEPYNAAPAAVVVNMCDNAAGANAVAVTVAAQSVLTTGFTVNVSSALTTAHNYLVNYSVVA